MNTDNITPSERQLLAEFSDLDYGHIYSLDLKDGIVTTNASSRKVRMYKPTHSKVISKAAAGAFELKDCQVKFLQKIHEIGNGSIRSIVIQNGLPVHFEIEEALTTI